jgi:hypothetical protein
MRELFTALMVAYFEQLDEELARDNTDQFINREARSVTLLFGPVKFRRRRYKRENGSLYFPLDERLQFKQRKQLTPYFIAVMAELAQLTTMRNAAHVLNRVSGTDISAQSVNNAVRTAAKEVQSEREAAEAAAAKERKRQEFLFLEGDAFTLKLRHPKRKVLVHHFRVYEARIVHGKRTEIIGGRDFVGLDMAETKDRVAEYITAQYDLTNTTIFTGSDAGPGYEPRTMISLAKDAGAHKVEYVLDRYHLLRKIESTLGFQNPLSKKAINAVRRYDAEKLERILTTYESTIDGEDKLEKLAGLRAYLERNWIYIKHPSDRGYESIGRMGSAESSHRAYTYRLKKQGKAWTTAGLEAMLVLIEARVNQELWQQMTTGFSKHYRLPRITEYVQIAERFRISMKQQVAPSVGAKSGRIALNGTSNSAIGSLARAFR